MQRAAHQSELTVISINARDRSNLVIFPILIPYLIAKIT